jgi:hypothetical protein
MLPLFSAPNKRRTRGLEKIIPCLFPLLAQPAGKPFVPSFDTYLALPLSLLFVVPRDTYPTLHCCDELITWCSSSNLIHRDHCWSFRAARHIPGIRVEQHSTPWTFCAIARNRPSLWKLATRTRTLFDIHKHTHALLRNSWTHAFKHTLHISACYHESFFSHNGYL